MLLTLSGVGVSCVKKTQVALSVMMTTITTLGAIVMTPLLCKLLLGTVVPVDAVGIAFSTVQVRASRDLVRAIWVS